MKIGYILDSVGPWSEVVAALQAADAGAIDAVGVGDRIHTPGGGYWGFLCGWAMLGAMAAVTQRVKLLPLVLDCSNHALGRLAKESSTLARISEGRFELGIGTGDYPAEQAAWGQPRLGAQGRVKLLEESVHALRLLWTGEQITFNGEHIHLREAGSRPVPHAAPKVVVGAGKSRKLIRSAATYADEINVTPDAIDDAQQEIARVGRPVELSVVLEWNHQTWPPEPLHHLEALQQRGVARAFIFDLHPFPLLPRLLELAEACQQQ